MRLHRFYVLQPLGEEVVIDDVSILKQWNKVFRYKKGDFVILFNPSVVFIGLPWSYDGARLSRTGFHGAQFRVWFFARCNRAETGAQRVGYGESRLSPRGVFGQAPRAYGLVVWVGGESLNARLGSEAVSINVPHCRSPIFGSLSQRKNSVCFGNGSSGRLLPTASRGS